MPYPIAAILAAETGTLFTVFTAVVAVSCCVVVVLRERQTLNREDNN